MVCSGGRLARFEIACAQVHELAKLIEVLISKSGTVHCLLAT